MGKAEPEARGRADGWRRFAGASLVAVIVLGWYGWLLGNPWVFDWCGLSLARGFWFGDTWVVLAASDAAAAGLDPFAAAERGFTHVYPRAWNGLSALGLDRGDFLWAGMAVGLGFLGVSIFWIRPRRVEEAVLAVLLLGSPAFALGFNRGNVDLVIAVLMLGLAGMLASQSRMVRWMAPGLVAAGTLMKFYPLAAGLALLGGTRSWRERLGQAALLAGLMGLFFTPLWEDYRRIAAGLPDNPGFFKFGATTRPWEAPWWGGLAWLAVAGCGWLGWRRRAPESVQAGSGTVAEAAFVVGAAVVAGCFFAGVSFVYRLVFVVLIVPELWRMVREETGGLRVVARGLLWGAVVLVWLDSSLVLAMVGMLKAGRESWAGLVVDESAWLRLPLQWSWVAALVYLLARRWRAPVKPE